MSFLLILVLSLMQLSLALVSRPWDLHSSQEIGRNVNSHMRTLQRRPKVSDLSLMRVRMRAHVHDDAVNVNIREQEEPHKARRIRYNGKYPRKFLDKYKEHQGDVDTITKVLSKGMTPAGTHVPIMLHECLEHMGLQTEKSKSPRSESIQHQSSVDQLPPQEIISDERPVLVVDCTLGYGGHSSYMLSSLLASCHSTDIGTTVRFVDQPKKLVAFDQDSIEIRKTEARLQQQLTNELTNSDFAMDSTNENKENDPVSSKKTPVTFNAVNQNFSTLGTYLGSTGQLGTVTSLLADLGLSSMQIDDNSRGFTYKQEGPLDMRMNQQESDAESAYDLLCRIKPKAFQRILSENSDEVFAKELAFGLLRKDALSVPRTTTELAERIREIAGPLLELHLRKNEPKASKKKKAILYKKQLDSTVARVMQAIRIEINGEFDALEQLLANLPQILAPGGRAVFLTFHSGEDRRVKKSFKAGFRNGIYKSWSRDVVRPTAKERRNNPRSSCCKLRWAILSDISETGGSDSTVTQ